MNAPRFATQRAVVLGASLAGLLAARALSEHFDDCNPCVTVDVFPNATNPIGATRPKSP